MSRPSSTRRLSHAPRAALGLGLLVVVLGACHGSELRGTSADAALGDSHTPADVVDDDVLADVGPDDPDADAVSGDTSDVDDDAVEADVAPDAGPGDTADPGDTVEPGDVGPDADTGGPVGEASVPSPPAVIVQEGSGGFLLRGVVVSGDGVHDPGELLMVDEEIRCVGATCTEHPEAAGVTVIDTFGVISPGLIDAHNHITYNFLTEWEAGQTFDSRDVWRDDPAYREHVAPYSDNGNNNDVFCPAAKWGELRSLIHGTTTVQGQSFNRTCIDRLVRNADHHHDLGGDHLGTTIASPADLTTSTAFDLAERFSRTSNPTLRYAVHMCEGVTGSNMAIEFESYAGRDPRDHLARHQGLSLLAHDGEVVNPLTGETYLDDAGEPYNFVFSGVAVLIHSIILTSAQIAEVVDTDSFVVWSPSSNLVLYGHTAPIEELLASGAVVGIGPDWTPSGEDELLAEMRVAHGYGATMGIDGLTWERIWRMATVDGSEVVGLGDAIGRLEVGYRADVAVFGRQAADPYRAIGESRAEDVRLVFIDGAAYYGDVELEAVAAVNDDCEPLDACGASKFICAANTPGSTAASARADETVAEVRAQLLALLADYDRDDLNELILCE